MIDPELLPLWATIGLVSALSLALIYGLSRLIPRGLQWAAAVILPFGISYLVYWVPVWARGELNKADYQGWEFLLIGIVGTIGALACLLLLASQAPQYGVSRRRSVRATEDLGQIHDMDSQDLADRSNMLWHR